MKKSSGFAKLVPRDRILAAAERLFAEKGMHGASIREIARAAGINVNLISYYFSAKEDLYHAVVDARARQLNKIRESQLNSLEAAYSPDPPPVEKILHSLVQPFFTLRAADVDGWSNWTKLLNRETGTALWSESVSKNLGPVLRRYLFILHRSLPNARRADILFILELANRAMVLSTELDLSAILPEESPADWTDNEFESRIVRFLSAAALALTQLI